MNLDLTWTITAVIAVTALISPIVTAIVNNHHDERMKLIDYGQKRYSDTHLHVRNLFENFFRLAVQASAEPTIEELKDLMSAYYQIIPYVPKSSYKSFGNYVRRMRDGLEAPNPDLDFAIVIDTYRNLMEEQERHDAAYEQSVWDIPKKFVRRLVHHHDDSNHGNHIDKNE